LGFNNYSDIIGKKFADRYEIVGVVEDFHLEHLKKEIAPAFLGFSPFNSTAAVTIALSTVSWQAIKAALANPVENLRNE